MTHRNLIAVLCLFCGLCLSAQHSHAQTADAENSWQSMVKKKLALYGHRNWIVIADSAYPKQSAAAIETVHVGGTQIGAVEDVLKMVNAAKHVRGVVFTDAELALVPEQDAPGVSIYRDKLHTLFQGKSPKTLPHDEIIAQLDKSAQTFEVLILKTDEVIPYTSVFIRLDCGYWGDEEEKRLRDKAAEK